MQLISCEYVSEAGKVLAPSLFNTYIDWVLGRFVEQRLYETPVGNTEITILCLLMMPKSFLNHWRFWYWHYLLRPTEDSVKNLLPLTT